MRTIRFIGFEDAQECIKEVSLAQFDPLEISADWEEAEDIALKVATPLLEVIKEQESELAAAREREERYKASLQMVRKMIRNSRKAPNLIDSIDRETFAALNPEAPHDPAD